MEISDRRFYFKLKLSVLNVTCNMIKCDFLPINCVHHLNSLLKTVNLNKFIEMN